MPHHAIDTADGISASSGSYLAVANEYSVRSAIYTYDPTTSAIVALQDVDVDNANFVHFFTMPGDPEPWVAFASNDGPNPVMRHNDSTQLFDLIQSLPGNGSSGIAAFAIGTTGCLAVANLDGQSVDLYQYLSASAQFVLFQALAVQSPQSVEAFTLNNTVYLAVATYQQPGLSVVYAYDPGAGMFAVFQNIATLSSFHMRPFTVGARQYLASASYYNTTSMSNDAMSQIFVYSAAQGQFVLFQTLTTQAAVAFTPFVIDGINYLFVSNEGLPTDNFETLSSLYSWSTEDSVFVPVQSIPTTCAEYAAFFMAGGFAFLAIPSLSDGQSNAIDSYVLQWCNGRFVIPESAKSSSHLPVVLGATLGVVLLLAAIAVYVICRRRHAPAPAQQVRNDRAGYQQIEF